MIALKSVTILFAYCRIVFLNKVRTQRTLIVLSRAKLAN